MQSTKTTYEISAGSAVLKKAGAFLRLMKFRLSMLVVFSAAWGYLIAAGETLSWKMAGLLSLGGFLVTGAANALNQVIETEHDRKMSRTQGRPMPTGRLSATEGIGFALVTAAIGLLILFLAFDGPVAGLLGIIALLSYAFVYTPLKRYSPIAVFVGAFPGAMPPLIGWAAATGALDGQAWTLFLILFLWQFPHFWAIAWLCDDDYRKAGFRLLPSNKGRSRYSAFLVLVYTLLMVPVALLPFTQGLVGIYGFIALAVAGFLYAVPAFGLFRRLDATSARRLMFASFLYLPFVQIWMLIENM